MSAWVLVSVLREGQPGARTSASHADSFAESRTIGRRASLLLYTLSFTLTPTFSLSLSFRSHHRPRWGIPFASCNVLSRPGTCGKRVAFDNFLAGASGNDGGSSGAGDGADAVAPSVVHAKVSDVTAAGLKVFCFQEAWSFKCGLAWPLLHLVRWLELMCPNVCGATRTVTFNPANFLSEVLRVNTVRGHPS